MSRSGYSDDIDNWDWDLIRWRGAVKSAMRGKRGQAFLREMLAALDALPEKKLVAMELEAEGQVCAIGSVGRARGIDMSKIDPEDYSKVAAVFEINEKLAREIVWMNDEGVWCSTPEERFEKMRSWIEKNIRAEEPRP